MNIAFFSDCYLDLTGGIVTSINAQKSALERNGHTVYIFSSSYPKSAQEQQKLAKNHIYPVPSCRLLFRGFTPVARRPKIIEKWLLRSHPEIKTFDIFYIHYEAGCSIAGLRLGKKLKIPTVQVMHGREDMGESSIIPRGFRTVVAVLLNWFHSWYLPHKIKIRRDDHLAPTVAKAKMWTLMVNHANFADYVITPSCHFAQKLTSYGVKHRIHVFPNGYPDANFPSNPLAKELKSGEPLRIIWHSRLSGEKRLLPFLAALAEVANSEATDTKANRPKVASPYCLDVYGDGPDRSKAERYVIRHCLNVKFHGNTPFKKVQAAIQKSHLDVLASYNFDNYPLTLVEAEACGVPVFICDPDMQEIIPKGSYLLSKSESPEDMATTLQNLLNHPEQIRQKSEIMLKHRSKALISHRIKAIEKFFHDVSNLSR